MKKKKTPTYENLSTLYTGLVVFFDEYIEASEADEDPAMVEYAKNLKDSISEAMKQDMFTILTSELVESGKLTQKEEPDAD